MKWTVTLDIDTDVDSPNIIGEFLRGKFWNQTRRNSWGHKGYGCYSTFEYNDGVQVLPEEFEEPFDPKWDEGTVWQAAKLKVGDYDIKCRWYWDGDGTIQFIFPNGTVLENTDCKKDYEWKWLKVPVEGWGSWTTSSGDAGYCG